MEETDNDATATADLISMTMCLMSPSIVEKIKRESPATSEVDLTTYREQILEIVGDILEARDVPLADMRRIFYEFVGVCNLHFKRVEQLTEDIAYVPPVLDPTLDNYLVSKN